MFCYDDENEKDTADDVHHVLHVWSGCTLNDLYGSDRGSVVEGCHLIYYL